MVTRRLLRRTAALASVTGVVLTLLTACGSDGASAGGGFRVGSEGTSAMRVAAQIYAGAIARTGVRIGTVDGAAGERRLLDDAAQGDIDLFPAFTGDLLATLTPAPEAISGEAVEEAVNRALPQGVTVGDPAAVSDRRQLVLAQGLATSAGLTDLSGCATLPPELPLVTTGTLTAGERTALSRCRFGAVEEGRTPQQVVDAVRTGRALGALTGLESAAVLVGHDDVIAVRSEEAGPMAQELVPVYRSAAVGKAQTKALSRVAGELTTADLAELAARVDAGADPSVVANEWISTHGV